MVSANPECLRNPIKLKLIGVDLLIQSDCLQVIWQVRLNLERLHLIIEIQHLLRGEEPHRECKCSALAICRAVDELPLELLNDFLCNWQTESIHLFVLTVETGELEEFSLVRQADARTGVDDTHLQHSVVIDFVYPKLYLHSSLFRMLDRISLYARQHLLEPLQVAIDQRAVNRLIHLVQMLDCNLRSVLDHRHIF